MFGGIVHGCYQVAAIEKKEGITFLGVKLPTELMKNLQIGASVAVAGVCLTAVSIEGDIVTFDVMQETLNKSTLHRLEVGSSVNIERSLKFGDEIGGHIVSGHIDTTATVVNVSLPANNHVVTLAVKPEYIDYIFDKGFVAIDGCSLTVCNVDKQKCLFDLWLIPETLRRTTFRQLVKGDTVNLEIDRQTQIIVETSKKAIDEYLKTLVSPPGHHSKDGYSSYFRV